MLPADQGSGWRPCARGTEGPSPERGPERLVRQGAAAAGEAQAMAFAAHPAGVECSPWIGAAAGAPTIAATRGVQAIHAAKGCGKYWTAGANP